MNARRTPWFLFALCALIGVSLPDAAQAAVPTKEELAETAAWFEGQDWPDLKGEPYVEVVMGKKHRYIVPPGETDAVERLVNGPTVRGFLLAEDADALSVFVDGTVIKDESGGYRGGAFAVQRIKKSSPEGPPEWQVTWRAIELPMAVEEAIAEMRRPEAPDKYGRNTPRKISKVSALFGLARWCNRAGRADLAAQLDAELLKLDTATAPAAGVTEKPFRAVVENEVARALMLKAMADLGEQDVVPPAESVKRPELWTQFARIAHDFPASADHAEAARIAEVLGDMITEDKAHDPIDRQKLEKMSREDQAREWIFKLREQQYFPSYMTDMPAETPVGELVGLGYAAVPDLIKTIGDQRLTRSVRWPRILTFGDCAVDALSEIAGRSFGPNVHAPAPNGKPARRDAIEAWWKVVSAQGERAMLIQRVRAGGQDASEKAERLAKVNPGVLVESISTGLKASKNETVRWQLVQQLQSIKSDDATTVLRHEARFGKDLRCRMYSAEELFARGATDMAPVMVHEFRKPLARRHYDEDLWADDAGPLIAFLGRCGDLTAMKALAARLPQVTPDYRALIVDAAIPKESPHPIPATVEALGEKIAVSALDDRALAFEPWPPSAGNSGGGTPAAGGPRVCDVAAAALARRWPDRYPLVDLPTKIERDAQFATFRNKWRATQGLKTLSTPKRSAQATAHDDANVIAEFRWIGGAPPPGFPGTLRQPSDSNYPFPVDPEFALRVGRPLTGKAFMTGVEQLQRILADERLGFAVSAERLGDQHGIIVEIEPLGPRIKVKHATLEFVTTRDLSLHTKVNGKPGSDCGDEGFDGGAYFYHDKIHAKGIDDALSAGADASVGVYFQSTAGQ